MKRRKLLHKTLTCYLVFGAILLLAAMPLYYFYYDRHYTYETDEYLLGQKDKIYRKSLNTLRADEIPAWNRYNDNEEILPDNGQMEENTFVTENIYDDHEKGTITHRVLYSRIKIGDEYRILRVPISTYEAKKIMWSGAVLQLVFFFMMLFCFFLITRLIYAKLWRPFYHTLSDIERFNIDSNEIPAFVETNIEEFGQLNNAVETLMRDNMQAYKTQKEFTENASHEMQTPLAVLQSKLDLLLQQPELNEEQLQIMQSLYEAISRLTRLNKNLLLLAKIDNLQFSGTYPLNVVEILNGAISFLTEQAGADGIIINTDIREEELIVDANRTLTESLVNNLLTNAVRHNVSGGNVSVSLEGRRLTVTNTGINKKLDENLLFRRFGRMNEKAKGNGLGLAIVRQICLLYDWKTDYSFESGEHRFVVMF